MQEALVSWLVAAMVQWAPPVTPGPEQEARYGLIARDAAEVAFDPDEPPLFQGKDARARTAAFVLSVAAAESGFAEDVEDGRRRGDGDQSWCLMQINLGRRRFVPRNDTYAYGLRVGWTGEDLLEDRSKCFRAGLRILRVSMRACGDGSLYLYGRCVKGAGAWRERRVVLYVRAHPVPGDPDGA